MSTTAATPPNNLAVGRKHLNRFPALDADDEQIRGYALRHFAELNTYRNDRLEDIVKAIYYEQGNQWIEVDRETLVEGVRGYAFRQMQWDAEDGDSERPMPVTNLITSAVDVEFSTLSKRQWTPKIPNLTRDPRQGAANKVANSILTARMEKLRWPEVRDSFIRQDILQGTAVLKSFWNRSWLDTAWFAAKDPHKCGGCGNVYASNTLKASVANLFASGSQPTAEDATDDPNEEDVTMDGCPNCGGALNPTELTEDESHGEDAIGRPLGQMLAKGGTDLELYSPFEYYPENGGVGKHTHNLKIHGLVKVRSLDWIEEHYPDFAEEVEPEDPSELMRWHPTLGDWDIVGRFDARMDSGVYDCHARVYELIAAPSSRFPKGRYIVMIGEQQQLIVENTDLMIEIEDENGKATVPLVEVAVAVWKPRVAELWGRGIADDLISPQNRINGIDSQTVEARERMGSPNLMIPTDASLQGPEFRAGYGLGKLFRYQPSALNPNAKPEVFGAITMPSGVVNERDRCIQDMTRIVGPADIEIGEAPRNITTTSGLQILGEQAERRRATRERSISEAFEKVWSHQMQMLWVMRVDEDEYEDELPDGSWEIKQYDRLAIAGQTKVKIEKQAYIERSIIIREGTREALTDQLYDRSTPTARKRLLEIMGLPTDVNDEDNLQIEHARRVWVDFHDDNAIPVIDPGIDNPSINYQVLGAFLKQDEGLEIAEDACWPHVLGVIAGWEQEYGQLSQQDAQVRAFYGGEPDPQAAAETYAKATIAYQNAKAGYEQQITMAKMMPGTPPPSQPPPQPPPQPVFVPRQIERRILLVWKSMLGRDQSFADYVQQKAIQEVKAVDDVANRVEQFLRFRAVVEGYRLMANPTMAPGSMPGAPGDNAQPPIGPGSPQPGAGLGPPQPGMAPGGVPTTAPIPPSPTPVTS